MKYIINIIILLCLALLLAQATLAQEVVSPGGAKATCDNKLDDNDIDEDNDGLIEICDLEGLNAIRYQLDGSGYRASADADKITTGCKVGGCTGYELVKDLDFNDDASYSSTANKVIYTTNSGWQPIEDFTNSFNSIFEGNGYTISNLRINRPDTDNVGLFGDIRRGAEINNISLLNVYIEGQNQAGSLVGNNDGSITNSYATGSVNGDYQTGGLVGYNEYGSITNSYATGSVNGDDSYTGGLVGYNEDGSITNSYATGSVNGDWHVGGLVGYNEDGSITNSYATGSVNGDWHVGGLVGYNEDGSITNSYATGSVNGDWYVGGLVGYNEDFIIRNSYATGSVTGDWYVGGLVGQNGSFDFYDFHEGSITNSYATGSVTGGYQTGGLVGLNGGSITNSYWDTDTSGILTSGAGIGKTTTALQSPTRATGIYSEWSTDDWDFGTASQYPVLKDENGDLLSPALRYGLSRLRLAEGNLSPDFVASVLNYTGTVVNNTNTIQLIPTAVNHDARIRIDSGKAHEEIKSDTTSSKIILKPAGITTITIVVINNENRMVKYNLDINYFRFSGKVDEDGNGLIEIDDIEGLNAIRYETDGTGYRRTSTEPKVTIGCPKKGCKGYELTGNLDLSGVDDWLPINAFTGIFEGNGYTISNLRINRPDTDNVGLFGDIRRGAEISNISLLNVDINGDSRIGGLVGYNEDGSITNSYATGSVTGDYYTGGLVGYNEDGSIINSYATGSVNGDSRIGGLVGYNDEGSITNSYATGSVNGDSRIGGLVGYNDDGSITNSYATGSVNGDSRIGGLVGYNEYGNITNSYWDTDTSGILTSGAGTSKTTVELQSPTEAGGTATEIYYGWSTDSWDFGTKLQYPVLKDENGDLLSPALRYGLSRLRLTEGNLSPDFVASVPNYTGTVVNNTNTIQLIPTAANPNARIRIDSGKAHEEIKSDTTSSKIILKSADITTITIVVINDENRMMKYNLNINYFRFSGKVDEDGNGLIEIGDIEGLNAIRYETDGTGYRKTSTGPKVTIGCPKKGCKGYELTGNLDLSGVDNWLPINGFTGRFEGNGYTISNLSINRPDTNNVGLFGDIRRGAEINNISLLNVDINGDSRIGGLVGYNEDGSITNSYATGSVTGDYYTGGLVGYNDDGNITNSYATGSVTGDYYTGGLVGYNEDGSITNSYATGSVTGGDNTGGLVGYNEDSSITNSYATGSVTGDYQTGGLVGYNDGGSITNSYWDTDTITLQLPTTATGIYSAWSTNNWDFGTSKQLPILKYNDACTTATKARIGQPICGTFLPNQGVGLRTLEASAASQVVPLVPVFSSEQSEYLADIPSNTDSIDLRLESYDADAAFEIKKQEDGTNYFDDTEKSTLSVNYGDILSIQVNGAGGVDTAATTITSYTLRMGLPPITLSAISVDETPAPGIEDADKDDNEVNEGSAVTLSIIAAGGSGDYTYKWMQTSGKELVITASSNATTLNFEIPDDFIESATTTSSDVTFTVTVTDSESNNIPGITVSETLTIAKQDNGELVMELRERHDGGDKSLIAAVVEDDPDGGYDTNTITYQWQERAADLEKWSDIREAKGNTYKIPPTITDINYRVIVKYKDGQGYDTELETGELFHTTFCDDAGDLDRDDDGLIEICDLEGLNAIRYQLGGSGYQASTATDKIPTGCKNGHCTGYELGKDLDFNDDASYGSTANKVIYTTGFGWQPIGDYTNSFNSRFEGNGYTISNLMINRSDTDNVGLFGYTASNSTISNISLLNVDIKGDNFVGGLVGQNEGNITNSYATGSVTGGDNTGGLVGRNEGNITNSYATGSVTGGDNTGGLVGRNEGSITNSYATGSVTGGDNTGGLVGQNGSFDFYDFHEGSITNSYATGSVTVIGGDAGGLVGSNEGNITNSYATGSVTGGYQTGGLVGRNEGSTTNSYWDTDTSGILTSGAGTSKTTVELQSPTEAGGTATEIYYGWSTDSWDFGTKLQYPVLKDENGDLLSPALRYGLSRLRLTEGNLSPNFVASVLNYTGTVVNNTNTIQLIPTALNPAARIRIDSGKTHEEIKSDTTSSKIILKSADITTITIVVINNENRMVKYNLDINYFRFSGKVDKDGNGLIEIDDVEGLNAIRYETDGTGYRRTSTGPKVTIGCPKKGCKGYELTGNLDLSAVDNWLPINGFTGRFEGNGYTISNLRINRPDTNNVGLFGDIRRGAEINNISLLNVDIKGDNFVGGLVGYNEDGSITNSYTTGSVTGDYYTGGLAGENEGSITNSYATGSVTGDWYVGGLAGENEGSITNSYATGSVTGDWYVGGLAGENEGSITNSYATGSVTGDYYTGGLVGENEGSITNSYATGSVTGDSQTGGLVGYNDDGSITNSYATGSVTGEDTTGGLVGLNWFGSITNSYWDTDTSGILTSGAGTPKTTVELQSPTTATGIYSTWSTDNWDFGTASQYPVLKDENGDLLSPALRYGLSRLRLAEGNLSPDFVASVLNYTGTVVNNTNTIQLIPTAVNPNARIRIDSGKAHEEIKSDTTSSKIILKSADITTITIVVINDENRMVKYNLDINYFRFSGKVDEDGNGLIEIDDIEGLNAIRYETDGTGYRRTSTEPKVTIGCPKKGCKGYELTGNLDLSAVDDWLPINAFTGIFEGNGYTISNLRINRPNTNNVGLFGDIRRGAEISNISLLNVDIKGDNLVGGLVGYNDDGSITNSYATGSVNGDSRIGGLVGYNDDGSITNSYATGSVNGDSRIGGLVGYNDDGSITNSYATGSVTGDDDDTGGLVGYNDGSITNSYATGSVTGEDTTGGLVGYNEDGSITNSYATGSVTGDSRIGGLVGYNDGSITNSYATGSVTGEDTTGGLVGQNGSFNFYNFYGDEGNIANSYATGSVTGGYQTGGLVGQNGSFNFYNFYGDEGNIANSYATGSVTGGYQTGGLVGYNEYGSITNSYWDTDTSGILTSGAGTPKTTVELQSPTTATGIYSEWSTYSWDFGTASQYPVLKDENGDLLLPALHYGLSRLRLAEGNLSPDFVTSVLNYTGTVVNNTNTIQLIPTAVNPDARIRIDSGETHEEIKSDTTSSKIILKPAGITTITIVVINDENRMVKYNLDINYFRFSGKVDEDGNGLIEIDDIEGLNAIRYETDGTGYRRTSTEPKVTIGCPKKGCKGYELTGNLDLSAVDDWLPINAFTGIFEGNGYTISNLRINRPDTNNVGLFGDIRRGAAINNISLLNVDIKGYSRVGSLVGYNGGSITNSYATGSVTGDSRIGGLVGYNEYGTITNSYATGSVTGDDDYTGGLVGYNEYGTITNSYATGSVTGDFRIGGLVGLNGFGSITNSYATGSATGGDFYVGGLVGQNSGIITNSYWDTDTSGILTSGAGTSKTTVELQSPTTATGIYSNWSTDNWDFGTSKQLPILKYNDACTTTTRARIGVSTICGTFLPNQGTGLRTLEALVANQVVPLVPVFSSGQNEYKVIIPPGTGRINLRLKSYDVGASFEIKKQGDDTDYFTDPEKSTIPISTDTIVTIQVTWVDTETATVTTTTYTLRISIPPITLSAISVTEDGAADTDNRVNEGSVITLSTIAAGISGGYQYQWAQTSGEVLATTGTTTATLRFEIPDDFVDSTLENSDVTFMVTVTDSKNNMITENIILTIKKQNNGELAMKLRERHDGDDKSLIADVVEDDPDGGQDPNKIKYQWQKQVEGSGNWMNIDGENTNIYKVLPTVTNIDYRLEVIYTDNQNHPTTVTEIYEYQAPDWEISATEVPADNITDAATTDTTVYEGSEVTLMATNGSDETYNYEWQQTSGKELATTGTTTAVLRFEIPDDFIKSATTTSSDVTFTVTVEDSENNAITETKTLTIVKQNNGPLVVGFDMDGTTLTAVVRENDPDGGQAPNKIKYQWQEKVEGSEWMPIASAANTKTYALLPSTVDVDYRVHITYTDKQGYNTTATGSYQYQALKLEISVTEDGTADTDDTVSEGSRFTLLATGSGGSGNYDYQWVQPPANLIPIPTTSSNLFRFNIPDTFIQSATSDTISVTFEVTISDNDSDNYLPITKRKTLTIEKNNSEPIIEAVVDGTTLTSVLTDADGYDPNKIKYQWQELKGGSWKPVRANGNMATYTKPDGTDPNLSHRVIVTYTDDQGHEEQVIKVYAGAGISIQIRVFPEGLLR